MEWKYFSDIVKSLIFSGLDVKCIALVETYTHCTYRNARSRSLCERKWRLEKWAIDKNHKVLIYCNSFRHVCDEKSKERSEQ